MKKAAYYAAIFKLLMFVLTKCFNKCGLTVRFSTPVFQIPTLLKAGNVSCNLIRKQLNCFKMTGRLLTFFFFSFGSTVFVELQLFIVTHKSYNSIILIRVFNKYEKI